MYPGHNKTASTPSEANRDVCDDDLSCNWSLKKPPNQGLHPTRATRGQVKPEAFRGGAWCQSWRDGQPLPVVSGT